MSFSMLDICLLLSGLAASHQSHAYLFSQLKSCYQLETKVFQMTEGNINKKFC